MRSFYYFLIGLLLFYIDTAIALVIPMNIAGKAIIFVPHLLLMYLLLVTIYRSANLAIVLSVVLGLITDLYYGQIYGIYLFGYILFVVIVDRCFKAYYRDTGMVFWLMLIFALLYEVYTALIYGILGVIQFDIIHFVLFRLMPTFVLNLLLLVILQPLIFKYFKKVETKIDSNKP